MDDVGVDAGESEVSGGVAVGESFAIDVKKEVNAWRLCVGFVNV